MTQPRIAVIGVGDWGRHIVRDLVALGCHVASVAISDGSVARAQAAGSHEIVGHLADLDSIDGVVIATPTTEHAASVLSIADLGVPIFCEKPLATTAADIDRIEDAAGDRLFVMHKWRYHPGVEALADIAQSGRIGRVLGTASRRTGWSNPHDDVDAAWILLPHDLSIHLEILGAVPTFEHAVGMVDDGFVRAVSVHGAVDDVPVSMEISIEAAVRDRSVAVFGSEGTARLTDPFATHIEIRPPSDPYVEPPEPELFAVDSEFPLVRELRAFIGYLEGGPAPKSGITEARAVTAHIEQARHMIGATPHG